jgi:hypothetical protein
MLGWVVALCIEAVDPRDCGRFFDLAAAATAVRAEEASIAQ